MSAPAPEGPTPPSPPQAAEGSSTSASVVQSKKEGQDAVNDIFNTVFSDQQPQHVLDGALGGVGDVVKGFAVGVGLFGASTFGGIKGGTASSVATGIAAGAAGLVGMTLYGGYRGVKRVAQGVINTGDAFTAARDGDKLWDDETQMFVRIDMNTQVAHLPSTDDDIFDEAKLELLRHKKASHDAAETATSSGEQEQRPQQPQPMRKSDHYQALGVSSTATRDEIRKAYTKKALLLHPDKNPHPEAAAEFLAVAEAYRVLSNEVRRAQYDAGADESHSTAASSTDVAQRTMDEDINPLEELCAGRAFHPFIGRLRYLLYMHPHMKFSSALVAKYQRRRRIRVAHQLIQLLSAPIPAACITEAMPMIEDMLSTSKIGAQLVLLIAGEYANAVRHDSQNAAVREADRMLTGTLSSISNIASVATAAGKTAVKAYRHTVEEGDMFQLILAACTGEVQDTAALAAKYALIDASVTEEERKRRAVSLSALATSMHDAATARLPREEPPAPQRSPEFTASS